MSFVIMTYIVIQKQFSSTNVVVLMLCINNVILIMLCSNYVTSSNKEMMLDIVIMLCSNSVKYSKQKWCYI